MNLKKIWDIYNVIKERLPKTYPRPKLAFYEDEDCMLKNQKLRKRKYEIVDAIFNPATWTISLPLNMTLEYSKNDSTIYKNTIPITKITTREVATLLLHEIGHIFAAERYGYSSKQYIDEKYCDDFANRWYNKLVEEKLLE